MGFENFRKRIKRQISDVLEIPGDIMLDLPKIVLVGNLQIFVENHRGIVEYTSNLVRIKVGEGEIKIFGEELILRNLLPDELVVEGKILNLAFL